MRIEVAFTQASEPYDNPKLHHFMRCFRCYPSCGIPAKGFNRAVSTTAA